MNSDFLQFGIMISYFGIHLISSFYWILGSFRLSIGNITVLVGDYSRCCCSLVILGYKHNVSRGQSRMSNGWLCFLWQPFFSWIHAPQLPWYLTLKIGGWSGWNRNSFWLFWIDCLDRMRRLLWCLLILVVFQPKHVRYILLRPQGTVWTHEKGV